MCNLLGVEYGLSSAFHSYVFYELPMSSYGIVVLSAIVCSILGLGFYKFAFFARKLIKKIRVGNRHLKFTLRIAVAAVIGGLLGLATVGVMGGGHDLIESIGTFGGSREIQTQAVFGLSIGWSLFI